MQSQLLLTKADSAGNQINYYRFDALAHSPAYTFFLRELANLIDSGYAHPITSWEDQDCACIYAEHDGQIIGAIVYSTRTVNKQGSVWLLIGSVIKQYQGLGIYRVLRTLLEDIARELGCWGVASYIHVNNQSALKMAEALGARPVYYYMAKKI
jgi:GNAT superfamily N-acetyltransferase